MDLRAILFYFLVVATHKVLAKGAIDENEVEYEDYLNDSGDEYNYYHDPDVGLAAAMQPITKEIEESKKSLSGFRDGFLRTIMYERNDAFMKVNLLWNTVVPVVQKMMENETKTTLAIIAETEAMGHKYKSCLMGQQKAVIKALSDADSQLEKCNHPLYYLQINYFKILKTIEGNLTTPDSVDSIFNPCIPVYYPMTNKNIEDAVTCVQTTLKSAFQRYYSVGRSLFNTIFEREELFVRSQADVMSCANDAIMSTAQPVADMFQNLEQCLVEMKSTPHARVVRDSSSGFRKFVKHVVKAGRTICAIVDTLHKELTEM